MRGALRSGGGGEAVGGERVCAEVPRAPFTIVLKKGEVTCRGPVPVLEACAARCDRAVEEKLLAENEFAQDCHVSP